MTTIDATNLTLVSGGNPTAEQQRQMRDLARRYCPQIYSQYQSRPITRNVAERCLDEAGLGAFRSRLDQYFPPAR
jgi:hypothetical protein